MTNAHAVSSVTAERIEPRITVSVVSHGHRAMIETLLGQIADLHNPEIARVVVVHNLPDSDLPKPLNAQFDLIQVHNQKSKGFSANHNMAFTHCLTPWFAVLNPDIEFEFGDPFSALLIEGEYDEKLGMMAPALVQPESGRVEPNRGVVTPMELIRRRLPGWKPPEKPAWLVGAFLFIRSKAFKELGGFDEGFELYCEDVDFGMRLRSAGWIIARLDWVRVIHKTSRNSHIRLTYLLMHMRSLMRLWRNLKNGS